MTDQTNGRVTLAVLATRLEYLIGSQQEMQRVQQEILHDIRDLCTGQATLEGVPKLIEDLTPRVGALEVDCEGIKQRVSLLAMINAGFTAIGTVIGSILGYKHL